LSRCFDLSDATAALKMSQATKLASDKLDFISFDTLLKRQDPFGRSYGRFDLSGVRLVTSAALVELATACHALANQGQRPTIIISDPDVRSYLLRANFVGVVAAVVRFEPDVSEDVAEYCDVLRGTNPLLIEVTRVDSGSALIDLLDRVVSVLCNRLGYLKRDAFDIATAVSEVSQNTFEHNRKVCGFFAMQVYGAGATKFLEIGIGDFGDGLATTLNRNTKNRHVFSDMVAIERATKLHVSAFDDPTHGTGLYHLLDITSRHGGTVQIRSGAAKIRYRTDQKKRWKIPVPHMPGVQVALTLPAKESDGLLIGHDLW
jgi:hypothetical protein